MLKTRWQIGDNVSVKCYDKTKHSIYFYKILSIDKNNYHLIDTISHRERDFSIESLDLRGNLEYNLKEDIK